MVKILSSPAGNRTPVSRVTGGDTYHYTTEDAIPCKRVSIVSIAIQFHSDKDFICLWLYVFSKSCFFFQSCFIDDVSPISFTLFYLLWNWPNWIIAANSKSFITRTNNNIPKNFMLLSLYIALCLVKLHFVFYLNAAYDFVLNNVTFEEAIYNIYVLTV